MGSGLHLGLRVEAKGDRGGESQEAPGSRLCLESHFVHGHAGDLCRTAFPISHFGEDGIMAYTIHRMVLK